MPLFDNIDIEITVRAAAGTDLALSGEAQAHAVSRSCRDVDGQASASTHASLARAFMTRLFNDGSIALTGGTRNLGAHGSQHGLLGLNRIARAVTGPTGCRFAPGLAHRSVAYIAGDVGIERNFAMRAEGCFFQGDLNARELLAALAGARLGTSAPAESATEGSAKHG